MENNYYRRNNREMEGSVEKVCLELQRGQEIERKNKEKIYNCKKVEVQGLRKCQYKHNNDRKMNYRKLEGKIRDSIGLKVY